jgi:hypothetical protein
MHQELREVLSAACENHATFSDLEHREPGKTGAQPRDSSPSREQGICLVLLPFRPRDRAPDPEFSRRNMQPIELLRCRSPAEVGQANVPTGAIAQECARDVRPTAGRH